MLERHRAIDRASCHNENVDINLYTERIIDAEEIGEYVGTRINDFSKHLQVRLKHLEFDDCAHQTSNLTANSR